MTSLWIIHRDETQRRALARLVGSSHQATLGAPGDAFFDEGSAPDAVLLGLAGDLEQELEFVHRLAGRQRHAGWILVGDAGDLDRARRLFDSLPATLLTYPPDPGLLRASLREAAARAQADPLPLSQRPARDALSERFSRAFSDLELPQLLRALDPRMGEVPVLIEGEPGSGRGTLARYLHHFGATRKGALVELRCEPETRAEDLIAALLRARHNPRSLRACTLWLADLEQLSPALQREVSGWVRFGPPQDCLRTDSLRWLGTSREQGVEPNLRRALGALTQRVPPLRERGEVLANLTHETLRAWCAARGLPPRRLGEDALAALEEYPWPGNIRELEAVLEQSLAASAADPLGAEDLVLDGEAFAPLHGGVLEAELAPSDASPRQSAAALEELPALEPLPTVEASLTREVPLEPEALPAVEAPPSVRSLETLEPGEDALPTVEAVPELALDTLGSLEEPEPAELLDAVLKTDAPAARADASSASRTPAARADASAASRTPAARTEAPAGSRRPAVAGSGAELTRLAAAVGHELRNPLTAVRALAELLPDNHADPEFRARFAELAGEGLSRVDEALERLDRLAAFSAPEGKAIDVGGLLEEVLDKRRGRIHERRLLVLEELDRGRPRAQADPEQLRFVFEALLDAAIGLVPERGHVYIASKRNTSGLRGGPSVRVLLRYRGPQMGPAGPQRADLAPAANALDVAVAEIVVRAQGGTLTLDTSDSTETVIVVDLPS